MQKRILSIITALICMSTLYAATPKILTRSGNAIYISLDWNKPTPKLSKNLFNMLNKVQTDSTDLFLSFYETGLVDRYGNQFVYVCDTIKVQSFNNIEIGRFKNYEYFNNQFNINDTITTIINKIKGGVDTDKILAQAEFDADRINLSERELNNKIDSLSNQYWTFYYTNPFNPIDNSCLNAKRNDNIGVPCYSTSLYFIIQSKKYLKELCYYKAVFRIKYPDSNVPGLEEDDD